MAKFFSTLKKTTFESFLVHFPNFKNKIFFSQKKSALSSTTSYELNPLSASVALIRCANQLTGFYMRATLALTGLNKEPCQNFEKTNYPIPTKRPDGRKECRKDRQILFCRRLSGWPGVQ